ncbi:30S ribosomal protein S13 [Candidatus Absconditicoccus praedator]|uniref:30S ribosomal protein S13 n=1 Tax=Candidatus Absconditicoccus praedator TaxID=2735562 RepID=UPI001E3D0FD3|nr:30S ribosomal protein S13 [Candidatus Absconditicoccus praedator]UFX82855.1 30S ribosomal protein S13 [Candidatus Absconditicoccus praedator]
MFRLQGHIIPDNKIIWVGLTHVYGIGFSRSKEVLNKLGIDLETKVKDITDEQQKQITDELKNFVLENDLRREETGAIKRLKEIKSYRGIRHSVGLPVRGQKTIKHAKTAKKLMGRGRVRPILKK